MTLSFATAPSVPLRIAVLSLAWLCSASALAYGGLWSSPEVRHAGVAVLLVDHPDDTVTALVQARFEGEPEHMAWVIPVRGTPSLDVSSSTVLQRLDAATAPQYWLEVVPAPDCDDAPSSETLRQAMDATGEYAVGRGEGRQGTVTRLEHGTVGAYEHVTIAVDGEGAAGAAAAIDWLTAAGFETRGLDRDVLGGYLEQGFDLLAFRLQLERRADATRPIVLTYQSETLAVPLQASAHDDAELMITLWVVGASHAVCANCASLVLNDARLDWLSARPFMSRTLPEGGAGPAGVGGYRPSNYDALVVEASDEADGYGFVTELAAPASQFREKVWWSVDADQLQGLVEQSHADGIDAIVAAAELYGSWDGFRAAVAASTTVPEGVTIDALLQDPQAYRDGTAVDVASLLQRVQDDVAGPVARAAALLNEGPYLTRLYGHASPRGDGVDPQLQYNAQLGQVGNVHVARQVFSCDDEGSFRVQTPQGGVIAGRGDGPWPAFDDASMPATLKIVSLSAEGSGEVIVDHSSEIADALREEGGAIHRHATQVARGGLTIGGSQRLTGGALPVVASRGDRDGPAPDGGVMADSSGKGSCAVGHAPGAAAGPRVQGAGLALWALLLCALRLRRARACVRQGAPTRSQAPLAALALALLLAGCSGDDGIGTGSAGGDAAASLQMLTPEQLRDPETCKDCHPGHYREWSSSMHAYAAMDPVFLAMNRRGQRETGGELGDFCIQCHAPMAVVDGLSHDGLNLEELPDLTRGVSCYFCHNTVEIVDDHNAQLRIAGDSTMRGPIEDAVAPPVHGVAHSELLDGTSARASDMCGTCHDIVTPSGVRLERTYQEYLTSVYSKVVEGDPRPFETCLSCHMRGRRGFVANTGGVPEREVHEHLFPGVDLATVDFPNRAAMRSAVEDCQLATSIAFFTLEVTPPDLFTFQIETSAGHNMPSGAAQDRRLWLEFLAYDEDGALLEDVSSGNIADGEIEEWPEGHPKHDPNLLIFRDRPYGADGEPVHMFWEAAPSEAYPDGYVSHTLPPATTTYLRGKHAIIKQYRASTPDGRLPSRVTARLRMRPIGLDVLQDLVDSGDLDPAIYDAMQTLDVGQQIEWTPADGMKTPIAPDQEGLADCVSYVCMLDPDSSDCR